MILLVVDDATGDRLASALDDRSVHRVSTLAGARDVLEQRPVRAVFATQERIDGASAVGDALGEAAPPVVAVSDAESGASASALGADDVVRRPFTAEHVRDALSRAERVGAYDEALGQFFALCRQRAATDEDAPTRTELKSARDQADRHLRAVQGGETSVFERLLRC